MASDGPKTALELAMERLRQKDREAGVAERPLTDEQKAKIAEIRNFYDAKLAEREILHQSAMKGVMDPESREKLDEEYRRDRDRIASERDRKIEEIRRKR